MISLLSIYFFAELALYFASKNEWRSFKCAPPFAPWLILGGIVCVFDVLNSTALPYFPFVFNLALVLWNRIAYRNHGVEYCSGKTRDAISIVFLIMTPIVFALPYFASR